MKTGAYFAKGVHYFHYKETDSLYKIKIIYKNKSYFLVGEKENILQNLYKVVNKVIFDTSSVQRVDIPKNHKIINKKITKCDCYREGKAHELVFDNGVSGTICFFCGKQKFVKPLKNVPEITLEKIIVDDKNNWKNVLELIKSKTSISKDRILKYIKDNLYKYRGEFFNHLFHWASEPFGVDERIWYEWHNTTNEKLYIPHIFEV